MFRIPTIIWLLIITVAAALISPAPVASQPGWDDRFGGGSFGIPGANEPVLDLVVIGSDLYACGHFTEIGGVPANRIARWDGSSWSPLGAGTNNFVYTVAEYDGDLYVAGGFTEAGGVPAPNIARWDGATWSALEGSPPDGYVNTLASFCGDLYMGGGFNTAGGIPVDHITRWDGASWHPLGSGVTGGCSPDNVVRAILTGAGGVYVGGCFWEADGVNTNHVASWDGGSFHAFGSPTPGVTGPVNAMWLRGTDLYIGGGFYQAGDTPARGITKWNGSNWSAVVDPLLFAQSFAPVRDIAFLGDDLFIAGEFSRTVDDDELPGIAAWTSTGWHDMEGGLAKDAWEGEGYALAVSGRTMYVGGDFTKAGGLAQTNLAKWIGNGWETRSVNNRVRAVAISGNNVYVGGEFDYARDISASHIAQWNGTNWSALGEGVNGTVRAIAVIGDDVYAGGEFTEAGGIPANYVAKWDGANWSVPEGGTTGPVHALATDGTNLYVGGEFLMIAGGVIRNIAKWDGANWSPLGGGTNAVVRAVAVKGGEVFAGGDFTQADYQVILHAARWDGGAWHAMELGLDAPVRAFAVYNGELYAGGDFTSALTGTLNHVAKWNGATWSGLPNGSTNGVDAPVYALAADAEALYMAGAFTTAGPVVVNHLTRWDGSAWHAFETGLDGPADAVAVNGLHVYAGGSFKHAGGKDSFKFAHWADAPTSIAEETVPAGAYLAQNVPNPFNPVTRIQYSIPEAGRVKLTIYSVAGELVRTIVDEVQAPSRTYSVEWDGRDGRGRAAPSGVYFYRLQAPLFSQSKKLVLLR